MSEQLYTELNNGLDMPMVGIGTFMLSPDEAQASCIAALEDGYRLIDTANAYVNEKAVGHAMAGFGGAMKNCSIGIAAPVGKALIHSGGTSTTQIFGGDQDAFLESMAEAASAVAAQKAGQMVYVNVMNNLSVD